MGEQTTVAHIRKYFLELTTTHQRHDYVRSLPEDNRLILLDYEDAFIRFSVGSVQVLNLHKKYNLSSSEKEIRAIQTDFYLNASEQSENSAYVNDHIKLIQAHNPSYALLTNEDEFEKDIETVLRVNNIESLREKVKEYEQQRIASENSKGKATVRTKRRKASFVIHRSLIRYASLTAVAASIFLIVWFFELDGPLMSLGGSDKELSDLYITSADPIKLPELGISDGGTRGASGSSKQDLSEIERSLAAEAVSLYSKKNYKAAVESFKKIGISHTKGNQYLIFMAVAQLATNDLEDAKENFYQILRLKDHIHQEDAHFYLSLYFLKTNNRKQARTHLNLLANNPGKYQTEAAAILKEIRWF